MVGGAVLVVLPFGAFAMIPLLLTGFLVGEAMSAAAARRGARGLTILAFACAVLGPVLGRAAVVALFVPGQEPAMRAALALLTATQSMGGFEVLLLLVSGVIATTRVQDR
jgi:hypothetical protein